MDQDLIYLVALGGGGVVIRSSLWRVLFGVANTFIGWSLRGHGQVFLQYYMKLLAVDIPLASGPDQRLFLIGDDEEEYRIGNGLISELRDSVVKALAAVKEFDARNEVER